MSTITLQQLADLIKNDDEIIIKNQEEGNKTLQSMDSNLKKFLENEKNARGDRLEAERERNKLMRSLGKASAAGAAGATAASKSKEGGMPGILNFLKGLTLGALGLGALKLAFGALAASANALKNIFDDRVKTQRGLYRIEAEELRKKQKAERLRARAEADRAKLEERRLRAESAEAHRAQLRAEADAKALEKKKKMDAARAKMDEADKLFKEKELKAKLADRAAADRAAAEERGARAKGAEKAAADARKARTAKASRAALADAQAQAVDSEFDPRGRDQRPTPRRNLAVPRSTGDEFDPRGRDQMANRPGRSKTLISELAKYSDADLETAGYKRIIGKNGEVTYRINTPDGTLPFAKHADVLAAVKKVSSRASQTAARAAGKAAGKFGVVLGGALAIADTVEGANREIRSTAEAGKVSTNVEAIGGGAQGLAEGIVGVADLAVYTAKTFGRVFTGKSNEEVLQESFGEESYGSQAGKYVKDKTKEALRALGIQEKLISAEGEKAALLGGYGSKEAWLNALVSGSMPAPKGVRQFDYSKAASNAISDLDQAWMAGNLSDDEYEKRLNELSNPRRALRSQAMEYYTSQEGVKSKFAELAELEKVIATYKERAAATSVNASSVNTDARTSVQNNSIQTGDNPNPFDSGLGIKGLE